MLLGYDEPTQEQINAELEAFQELFESPVENSEDRDVKEAYEALFTPDEDLDILF